MNNGYERSNETEPMDDAVQQDDTVGDERDALLASQLGAEA